MSEIKVAMEEMAFTQEANTTLVTEGVSTCIAFIVHGIYWDEDENQVQFCGLYHWPGFNNLNLEYDIQSLSALDAFFLQMREALEIDEDEEITITSLQFIGGEKAQYDKDQQLLISGTEKEVEFIIQTARTYEYAEDNIKVVPDCIHHYPYLTSDNQDLTITVSLNQCTYSIEAPMNHDEQDENRIISDRSFKRS